ncbi:hypothetical protein AMTRI_Chr06g173000 [Amborella trichopoda]
MCGRGRTTLTEQRMEAALLICCCVVFISWVFTVKVGYAIWWRPRVLGKQLEKQGIRGPPYKLLYGNVKEINKLNQEAISKPMGHSHQIVPRIFPFFLETVQNYGKICVTWFGETPRVIIMDTELIKDILSDKFGHFAKPPVNPLVILLAQGLALAEGEKWARQRRIINPAFHMEKLKGMLPEFARCCKEMVERWEKLVGEDGNFEIDVLPELQNLTVDVISRTAFGSSFEEGKRIFELQQEQADLCIQAVRTIYIPGFRFVPTEKNMRRKKIHKKVRGIIQELIQKKETEIKSGTLYNHDLLGLLLESNNTNDNKSKLTLDDVIEECKLFYFAGQETTSTLLTWTMVVLSMHPTWQQRARDEVMQVIGSQYTYLPTLEQLSHLKIVNMILNEVLRLYPPGPLLLRQTYKRISLRGIDFPAGVELALPVIMIHHDRELWGDDADEFQPTRFSDGVSKASKHPFAFFPFGGGPRICIGQNFALIEAKMVLAMVLMKFSFHLSPLYTHAPCQQLTLQPQHGAPIILHKL